MSEQEKKSLQELIDEGIKLGENNEYDEAEAVLKKAVEEYSDSALAHYNLSVVYAMRLKKDLAHNEVWEDRAEEESFIEEAISELETAVSLDPKMKEAFKDLGKLCTIAGIESKAIEYYETALSLDPGMDDVREELKMLKSE